MTKKILVIGPSHVKRLEHAFRSGIVPNSTLTLEFLGRDGMPIWHPVFSKYLQSADYDHIFVIVGDFRFGNKIFAKTEAKNAGGVAKDLINLDNDQQLYEKSLAKIDEWIAVFGHKIRFIFWDLLGREFVNRRDNKYMLDGQYRHPTWNYNDISVRYPQHIIDVGFLKNRCMNRLTVDSANHFSMFAYLLIFDAIHRIGRQQALNVDQAELEVKCQVLDQKFRQLPLAKIYLICDPPIYRRLTEALTRRAWPSHSELTLITTQEFIAHKLSSALADNAKVLYLSSLRPLGDNDDHAKYQRFVNTLARIGLAPGRFNIIFYDYLRDYVFELRKKQQNLPFKLPEPNDAYALETLQKIHANTIDCPIDDYPFLHSLFELSGHLPNFKGFFFLLMSAALGRTSAAWLNFCYGYFINDVFETANRDCS